MGVETTKGRRSRGVRSRTAISWLFLHTVHLFTIPHGRISPSRPGWKDSRGPQVTRWHPGRGGVALRASPQQDSGAEDWLAKSREEVEGFKKAQVSSWAEAVLIDGGLEADDEFIQRTATTLQQQGVTGKSLLKLTLEKLMAAPYSVPGGPAELLAEKIRLLQQPEGTSRLQRYLAPKYDLREKHIDGQKLLVCDFKDSTRFAIVSSELMPQLTAWVEDCVSSRGICAINGMVKLGKTTVLTRLLPQIILTKFPNAEICFLDFASFLNAGFEPGAMEVGLLREVWSWATSTGFHVGPADQWTLNQLMDTLDRSGRTVFFLIDEVQRFFQVQEGTIPTWDILKGFLRVHREDSNLHFAITGSDMALAWQNFVRMTPNGFTFAGECRRVSLPWQNPVHELDYARQKFLATAIDDTEKDELTDLLGEIRSVPLMAYTAAVWKDEQSKIDTQKRVNMKLRDEFVTEMTPLLGDPSWSKPQRLQYIRDLAIGQATSDPADFFDETVYDCFFKPYIYEADGKFSFASNPWTVCVAYCVDASGTLLKQSNFPVLQWCQNEQRLQQLARVGELVKGTLRRWFPSAKSPLSGDQKKLRWRVESICRRHGRQHGWHPEEGEPYFQQLLNWSNSGVNVSIRERQLNRTNQNKPCRLDMRWCTYLEMLRNANAHVTSRNRADYEKLLFNCLPSQTGLLLAALRNFTLSRPR
ncbi:unnamed protein product [Effrenium voratum]|nr:unnamed protein product [Effrenium voratum]